MCGVSCHLLTYIVLQVFVNTALLETVCVFAVCDAYDDAMDECWIDE